MAKASCEDPDRSVIAEVAALCLIFIVMLIITRSFVAALIIVGTVLVSLGGNFGLSVFVWQYLAGHQIPGQCCRCR